MSRAKSKPDVAFLAMREAMRMRHGLQAQARAQSGNPRLQLHMTPMGPSRTDGKNIWVVPPLELGQHLEHNRLLCAQYDRTGASLCDACRTREVVQYRLEHELSHITQGTFEEISYEDFSRLVDELTDRFMERHPLPDDIDPGNPHQLADYRFKVYQKIGDVFVRNPGGRGFKLSEQGYMTLASVYSPWLPGMVNALEDARVNHSLHRVKPGTRRYFQAITYSYLEDGFATPGSPVPVDYRELDVEIQILGLAYFAAAGYTQDLDLAEYFADEAVDVVLFDPEISGLVSLAVDAGSVSEIFDLARKVLAGIQRHGYMPDPPPPEVSEDPGQGQEQGQPDQGQPDQGQPDQGQPGASQGQEQGQSDQPDQGQSDQDQDPDNSDNSEAEDNDSDDSAGQGETTETGDDETEGPGAAGDEPTDDDGGGDEGEGSGDSSPEDGDADDEAGGGGSGATDGDGDGDADPDQDPAEDQGDGEADGADGGGEAGGAEPDEEQAGAAEEDEPVRGGEDPSAPAPSDDEVRERVRQALRVLNHLGGHEERNSFLDTPRPELTLTPDAPSDEGQGGADGDEDDDDLWDDDELPEPAEGPGEEPDELSDALAMLVGGSQAMWYQGVSMAVASVDFYRLDSEDWPLKGSYRAMRDEYCRLQAGGRPTPVDPTAAVNPEVPRARLAFTENRAIRAQRSLPRGKVHSATVGQKLVTGDPKVFYRKDIPSQRDYAVIIGGDFSGSTNRVLRGDYKAGRPGGKHVMELTKEMMWAQAALLHRLGINFSVYGHTADILDRELWEKLVQADHSDNWDMGYSQIFAEVKSFKDPWNADALMRLQSLKPAGTNYDGHNVEVYWKILAQQKATHRLLIYYTDGEMPSANFNEEVDLLRRMIQQFERTPGWSILMVGAGTDSPKQYGVDTVEVWGAEDLPKVTRALARKLAEM